MFHSSRRPTPRKHSATGTTTGIIGHTRSSTTRRQSRAAPTDPDVRTDLGNCFRFINEPHRALEQYQIAQTENPMHENSLFNQAGLYAEVLHDNQRALAIAREFLKRFPQGDRAAAARQLISRLEEKDQSAAKP